MDALSPGQRWWSDFTSADPRTIDDLYEQLLGWAFDAETPATTGTRDRLFRSEIGRGVTSRANRVHGNRYWKNVNRIHRGVQRLTGGRIGWRMGAAPVLRITTVGRRTGRAHTVLLPAVVTEESVCVVVASRGGDVRHPAWFLNLRAHPRIEVAVGGRPAQPMDARVASPVERARLWPKVVAAQRLYAKYQSATPREIPLVLIEPVT